MAHVGEKIRLGLAGGFGRRAGALIGERDRNHCQGLGLPIRLPYREDFPVGLDRVATAQAPHAHFTAPAADSLDRGCDLVAQAGLLGVAEKAREVACRARIAVMADDAAGGGIQVQAFEQWAADKDEVA